MPKKINKCGFGNIDLKKIGSNVYSGTAEFGKDYTIITTIITLLICVFFIIGGIFMSIRKPQYTKQTTMIISDTSSFVDADGKLTYLYTGKIKECGDLKIQLIGADYTLFNVGDSVIVFIKEDGSCSEAHLHTDNFRVFGLLFIVFAIIVGGFSLINLFFVKKYKGIAAVEGVSGVMNLFRR
jgi:hypothetical protein